MTSFAAACAFPGAEFRMARLSWDLSAGDPTGLAPAGNLSALAEGRQKEALLVPVWVYCSTVQNSTGAGFLPKLPSQTEKKNLSHRKALKGRKWPEVLSAALLFNLVVQGPLSSPFHPFRLEKASSKFRGNGKQVVRMRSSVSRD